MEFKFDPNLKFQTRAIRAAVNLFEGASYQHSGFELTAQNGAIGNNLEINDDELLENLQNVQQNPDIQGKQLLPESDSLDTRDFSVEMETGTGKTYVYLRTILKLHQRYGLQKFIIVVPSVAIREGVLKTLRITREHFNRLYDKPPYRFYAYNSEQLQRVRQFASSNNLEIMVMTLDSFNKDSNIFNRRMDTMMGAKPLELVQSTRPILVLDEPQNMESDLAQASLASLNPLATFRYSASHRNYYNLIYRLTPVDAYNLGLVKKIEVASVVQDHDQNRAYVECLSVDAKKTVISARLKVFIRQEAGPVPKVRTVRVGDDLYKITGLDAYEGFIVENLDAGFSEVTFANGVTVSAGEVIGPDHEAVAQVQIRHTIEQHMRKAAKLRKKGIKVLSLFFIDQVANYTGENGYIRRLFEQEFNNLKQSGGSWAEAYKDVDVSDVQGSYFSEYRDENYIESDAEAYDLIMRKKEDLLSFDEPTEFIFSHSALREGWDNPNIFQICTLNRTISTIKKRQEIGRGMRLAVDQTGERIFDEQINRLTVVANESYEEYAERLQEEYIAEVGDDQKPQKPKNARKRRTVKLKKGFELNPEFKELWEQISQKTRYKVQIDTDELISACVEALNQLNIERIKVRTKRGSVEHIESGGMLNMNLLGQGAEELDRRQPIPNVTAHLANRTKLTRRTIRQILEQTNTFNQIFNDPAEYMHQAENIINNQKRRFLVHGVRYIKMNGHYDMSLFEDLEGYEDAIIPIENSIYEQLIYDSDVEKDFAQELDDMDEVKLFIKLPSWFTVPTPLGSYNPDWAITFQFQNQFGESEERLYLVRETKGSEDPEERSGLENLKIKCANRHFDAIEVDYDVESDAHRFYQKLSQRREEK